MQNYYLTIYQSEDKYVASPLTPADMISNNSYDCEDFAHALLCLAKLYNRTCEPYFSRIYFNKNIMPDTHIGVACYDKNNERVLI